MTARAQPVRKALPFLLLAVAVVVIGLLSRSGRGDGPPLDPKSTGPLGARGLVLLLERFGADVRLSTGVPESGTAVILVDTLNRDRTDRLRTWVEGGGTLIVADPFSDFAPALDRGSASLLDFDGVDGQVLEPKCDLPVLDPVRVVDVPGAAGYRVRDGGIGCFPVGGGSFLVARSVGSGTVVAMGGGGAFINDQLDAADNALLAVALMAPRAGSVVSILVPGEAGSGDTSLTGLVSRRVKDGLWQLLIAFAVFALWRARRLGRPIAEPQRVQIDGSELVVAVGNLLQQARRREAAAGMLQADLRRTIAGRLGLPPDAPVELIATAAAERAGADHEAVARALASRPPVNDAELVELAQSVATLRKEVTRAR